MFGSCGMHFHKTSKLFEIQLNAIQFGICKNSQLLQFPRYLFSNFGAFFWATRIIKRGILLSNAAINNGCAVIDISPCLVQMLIELTLMFHTCNAARTAPGKQRHRCCTLPTWTGGSKHLAHLIQRFECLSQHAPSHPQVGIDFHRRHLTKCMYVLTGGRVPGITNMYTFLHATHASFPAANAAPQPDGLKSEGNSATDAQAHTALANRQPIQKPRLLASESSTAQADRCVDVPRSAQQVGITVIDLDLIDRKNAFEHELSSYVMFHLDQR